MADTEQKVAATPQDISREGSICTEHQAPQAAEKPEINDGFIDHFTQDIRTSLFVELQLLLITFCTGIQALVVPKLNGDMFYTANIGTGLGVFLFAGWLTGQLGHIIGPRKRWWLILCNLVQTCLVFAATAVQYRYGVHGHGPTAIAVVALLAFAAGSQVVQSRSLAATEISTAMATAAWVDLMIDQKLFVVDNHPRTRRIAFLIALVVGGLIGALIYRTAGSAAALAVSGGGKALATLLYAFSGAEKKKVNTSKV
ncbi:hypothetical protein ACHAQJ_009375 [Trichoderma viride]